jgi:hypothetical protein
LSTLGPPIAWDECCWPVWRKPSGAVDIQPIREKGRGTFAAGRPRTSTFWRVYLPDRIWS